MYEHKFTYYILWAVVALFTATGLTSCSSDDDPVETPPVESEGEYRVSITINAGSSSTRGDDDSSDTSDGSSETTVTTAIDWDNLGTEDGVVDNVVNENYMDPSNIHVYIVGRDPDTNSGVNWNGAWLTYSGITDYKEINWTSKVQLSDGGYMLTATIPAAVAERLSEGKFKLITTVNWSEEANAAIKNLPVNVIGYMDLSKEYRYNYTFNTKDTDAEENQYYLPTEADPMPLFGIKSYDDPITFKQGELTDLGEIKLIRAMAKIEVMLDTEKDTQSTISDVCLKYCYSMGMSGPRNMWINTEDPIDAYQNIPGDGSNWGTDFGTILENIPFYKIAENHYVIYVPEYRLQAYIAKNTNSNFMNYSTYWVSPNSNNKIILTLNGAEREIEFRDYNGLNKDGITKISQCKQFNILRNHIYRYYVSAQSAINYMVESWDKYTAPDIEFN